MSAITRGYKRAKALAAHMTGNTAAEERLLTEVAVERLSNAATHAIKMEKSGNLHSAEHEFSLTSVDLKTVLLTKAWIGVSAFQSTDPIKSAFSAIRQRCESNGVQASLKLHSRAEKAQVQHSDIGLVPVILAPYLSATFNPLTPGVS